MRQLTAQRQAAVAVFRSSIDTLGRAHSLVARWPWLAPLGLVLGMIGVVFIFIWGWPQTSLGEQRAFYARMGEAGLILVFIGFACQLVAGIESALHRPVSDDQPELGGLWRKVRRANIPDELRAWFELFGEDVLAHALGAGAYSSKGAELERLLETSRSEMLAWLQERRDLAERHAQRMATVQAAILIFIFLGVVVDFVLLLR